MSRADALLSPEPQRALAGDVFEIVIGRKQHQVVPYTKLRQQSINRSDLCPGSPTAISQISGVNVIIAIGYKER